MPIRAVSRKEFDAFNPFRASELDVVLQELEWFADDGGIVIGVIALDLADQDYFVGVLGPDGSGVFRAIDVESCLETVDDARAELMSRMQKALASGETVFPQED